MRMKPVPSRVLKLQGKTQMGALSSDERDTTCGGGKAHECSFKLYASYVHFSKSKSQSQVEPFVTSSITLFLKTRFCIMYLQNSLI